MHVSLSDFFPPVSFKLFLSFSTLKEIPMQKEPNREIRTLYSITADKIYLFYELVYWTSKECYSN